MAPPVSLFLWLFIAAVLTPSTAIVTLTQVTPAPSTSGAVCPGVDLVYSCNSTVSNVVVWRVIRSDGFVSTKQLSPASPQNYTFQDFRIQLQVVHFTFVPSGTIVSTATLKNALFSESKTRIECSALAMTLNDTAIVLISGISTRPVNLSVVPQDDRSVLLSWASPDSNCSFTYVVNSTSNGSSVAQYRTNTTSLTVTDLSVATMYHFAVAVEDADLTIGSWSEVVEILWDVPEIVSNITLMVKMGNLKVNWMQVENTLRPPIIWYSVTHNLTVSGTTVFITVTSPVADIPLNGVPPGHYDVTVTVAAVNVVGHGQRSQESFTVSTINTPVASSAIMLTSSFHSTSLFISIPSSLSVLETSPPDVEQVCAEYTITVTVSVLVSGVVSAISTAIVTSIIVWCVMRRPPSPAGTGTADDRGATELATVIYDTPHVIKEHNDQSVISTQDNVAYGGTIPLKKQNEDYEQVHIN